MGNTLHGPCAIEVRNLQLLRVVFVCFSVCPLLNFGFNLFQITEEYYPWERGQVSQDVVIAFLVPTSPFPNSVSTAVTFQVVVELSRNVHHSYITFVGERRQAAERLWTTLCQTTQWTSLTESIVDNLAITLHGNKPPQAMSVIDIADSFPWRICDQFIPCSNSGFVYLLVSTPAPERVYVGTTKNLAVRLTQHNRGFGSEGTGANPEFLPWAVLSYMTNMASLSRSERMGLERRWQLLNARSVESGMGCIEQYIENGRRVVKEHNGENLGDLCRRINYVILAQRRYAPELAEEEEVHFSTSNQRQLESEVGDINNGDASTHGDEMDTETDDWDYISDNDNNMELE